MAFMSMFSQHCSISVLLSPSSAPCTRCLHSLDIASQSRALPVTVSPGACFLGNVEKLGSLRLYFVRFEGCYIENQTLKIKIKTMQGKFLVSDGFWAYSLSSALSSNLLECFCANKSNTWPRLMSV